MALRQQSQAARFIRVGAALALIAAFMTACSGDSQGRGLSDAEARACVDKKALAATAQKALDAAHEARATAVVAYNSALTRQGKLQWMLDQGGASDTIIRDYEELSDQLPDLLDEVDVRTNELREATSARDFVLQDYESSCRSQPSTPSSQAARGLDDAGASTLTPEQCATGIRRVDAELSVISALEAMQGAYQNRLASTISAVQTASENLASRMSRVRPSDNSSPSASAAPTRITPAERLGLLELLPSPSPPTSGPLSRLRGDAADTSLGVGLDEYGQFSDRWSAAGISADEMEVVLSEAYALRTFIPVATDTYEEQLAAWSAQANSAVRSLDSAMSKSRNGVIEMEQRAYELMALRTTYLTCRG